ncbi:hypothetical protein PIB30_076830 [Stylosanthes scabra]|uniref:Uncharacterized protein n=1 Tax=Stylosanthes scabra TaxID=79078 RepID=A0ABU6SQI2_9FABA|nr:hypothetical protein [Stylosanthes scabra]
MVESILRRLESILRCWNRFQESKFQNFLQRSLQNRFQCTRIDSRVLKTRKTATLTKRFDSIHTQTAHPKKFCTPGKPFPMFQRLGRIFRKDRATGSAAVSGFDAEEQVDEEADEEEADMDDVFMSGTPTADAPSRSHGNVGQGTATSTEPSGTRKTLSGKKRKQMDILERMADEVHDSTAAQKEHVQILANAISVKNNDVKMGEKLE